MRRTVWIALSVLALAAGLALVSDLAVAAWDDDDQGLGNGPSLQNRERDRFGPGFRGDDRRFRHRPGQPGPNPDCPDADGDGICNGQDPDYVPECPGPDCPNPDCPDHDGDGICNGQDPDWPVA